MPAKSAILLSLAILLIHGCTSVPYTGRRQLMMVSEADEIRIGEASFARIKLRERVTYDYEMNMLVRRVGKRIAAAVDRPDYKWEFIVIRGPEVNAFALPGGKVAFYSGILPICGDEAGVAAVMGHEVAHVLARHGAERLSQSRAMRVGRVALSLVLPGTGVLAREGVLAAYGIGTKVGVALPFSRAHESEADEIGLYLMAKAGYDPRAAVEFWKRMNAQEKKSALDMELLSTHPASRHRIERLEALLPKAMDIYNETRASRQVDADAP